MSGLLMSDLCVLIIGIQCWAKAPTIREAKCRARKHGGSGCLSCYAVYVVHEDSYVNGTGDIVYTHPFKPIEIDRKG